jgi:hypothetical protein
LKGRLYLLSIAAAVLVCVGLAQTQQGHVLLRNAGLYETPAVYTELTFSDPGSLPSALSKPNENVKVSFSIHNVSDVSHTYQWSIAFMHSGKSQPKASGAVVTPAQGRTGITKSLVAGCTGGRLQVVVRLASPAESVGFWVTCPTEAKRKTSQ